MEGSKTLFGSSKCPREPESIPSTSTNNFSTTSPQTFRQAWPTSILGKRFFQLYRVFSSFTLRCVSAILTLQAGGVKGGGRCRPHQECHSASIQLPIYHYDLSLRDTFIRTYRKGQQKRVLNLFKIATEITNSILREPGISKLLIPQPVIRHEANPIPSTFHVTAI